MPAAADVGQSVVAAILGLGAAGVAGGIVAMARTVHLQQIQLAERLARRDGSGPADIVEPPHAANGNGATAQHANGTTNGHANGQRSRDRTASSPASRCATGSAVPKASG